MKTVIDKKGEHEMDAAPNNKQHSTTDNWEISRKIQNTVMHSGCL
jgi:hypothetical protein